MPGCNDDIRESGGQAWFATTNEGVEMKTMQPRIILVFLAIFNVVMFGEVNFLSAQTKDYPARQIQLVIDRAPGDPTDLAARAIADQLTKLLNVAVVAVNKPAAGGVEAADYVAKARKDGYTLLFCAAPAVVHIPVTSPETVPYDPVRDLEPIARAVSFPFVIAVKSDSPWKSLKEFVAYAKGSPDKARMGVAGIGTVSHFNLAILNSTAGVNMTAVPYKGAAPAVTAVLGGHIEGNSLALGANLAQINAGKLRALVISSKSPQAAQIPSPAEAGYPQMKLLGVWVGAFAPAGTPDYVLNLLIPAFEKAIRSSDVSTMADRIGVYVDYLNPDGLRKSIKEESEIVREIAKRAGLRKN